MICLVYVSAAKQLFDPAALNALLIDPAALNALLTDCQIKNAVTAEVRMLLPLLADNMR